VRHGGGGWAHETAQLQLGLALLNTSVLVAGSAIMARAHGAARAGRVGAAARLLTAAALLGVVFLAIKGGEYGREFAAGVGPGSGPFWGFYFALTGVHALHVAAGVLLAGVLAVGVGRCGLGAGAAGRIGAAALYWHFIDAVWLTLVALLYLGSTRAAVGAVITALAAGAVASAGVARSDRILAVALAAGPLVLVTALLLVLAPDLATMR